MLLVKKTSILLLDEEDYDEEFELELQNDDIQLVKVSQDEMFEQVSNTSDDAQDGDEKKGLTEKKEQVRNNLAEENHERGA